LINKEPYNGGMSSFYCPDSCNKTISRWR
jgi:hypothetical protein